MRAGFRAWVLGSTALAVCVSAGVPARAIPPAAEPLTHPKASPSALPTTAGPVLPYGSPLLFVLDDKIDSGKTPNGTVIHLHLQSPLVVNGVTIAPAGAPDTLTVIAHSKADIGDTDGVVQVHIEPFALPGRDMTLPLRVVHEYLTIEHTGGQLATRETADTIGDIFIPYHVLYRMLRPGHQFVLPPGSVLRAETQLTIDATDPKTVVFSTPPPFESSYDTPHSDLTAQPFYTPAPQRPHPLPKGKPTLPPKPTPSADVTDSPSAGPTASPVAGSTASPNAAPTAIPSPAPSVSAAPAPAPTVSEFTPTPGPTPKT